jgi:hypothetical protein
MSRGGPECPPLFDSAILSSMNRKLSDTQPEAERVLIDLLRQTPIPRKLAMMEDLNQMGRSLILTDLRQRYPNASEAELRRLLADRLLGAELAEEVYGPLRRQA